MSATRWTMGRDQYGHTYHDLGQHPRKTLCERLGRRHVAKMYVDKRDGGTAHVGYVIGGRWITLYQVEAWERGA